MALEQSEIELLVKAATDKAKPFIGKGGDRSRLIKPVENLNDQDKTRWPEYYPGYNKKVQEFEDILVHSMEGIFPERLFAEAAPNQEPKEFEYMKKNYKPTTLPVFADYVSTTSRPWHKSNWHIKYMEDDSIFSKETLQEYLSSEIPLYFSLENFMKNVMPSLKARDAEGVITVKPKDIVTIEKDGERVISPNDLIKPIPVYYSVKQVVSESSDHALILLKEKSVVTEGKNKIKAGLVYEFYDENTIWKITQIGRRIDFIFEAVLFFQHNWGHLPVYKLMGIPHAQEEKVVYQSPFLFAVPNLDLVAIYQSDLQATIKKCAYPYRIMIGDVCEFEDDEGNQCDKGRIAALDKEGELTASKVCPSCFGAGLVSRVSRLGTMLLKPESSVEGGDETRMTAKPMEYVSPPVDILGFMRSEIHEHETRGRRILHLNTTNDIAKGSEDATATAHAINLKAMAAFVAPISDQMFFLYQNVIDAIGWMRYGAAYKRPEIAFPTTFDFSTEADYVNKISQASEAGVPPVIIEQILLQFIRTIYINDETSEKVFRLVAATDRLLPLTFDQINMKVARGTVAKWEEVLHCSSTSLIGELIEKDKEFLNKELSEQKTALEAQAKTKVITPATEEVEEIVGA